MYRNDLDRWLAGSVASLLVAMSLACGFGDDESPEPRTIADSCADRCALISEGPEAHEDAQTPHPCADSTMPADCESRCIEILQRVETEGGLDELSCRGCLLNSMGWWGRHTETREALDLFETSCVEFRYFGRRATKDTDIVGDCQVQSACEEFHYPAPEEPNAYCGSQCGYEGGATTPDGG